MSDNKEFGKVLKKTAGVVLGTCVVAGGAFFGTKAVLPLFDKNTEYIQETESNQGESEYSKKPMETELAVKKTKDNFLVSAEGVTDIKEKKEPQTEENQTPSTENGSQENSNGGTGNSGTTGTEGSSSWEGGSGNTEAGQGNNNQNEENSGWENSGSEDNGSGGSGSGDNGSGDNGSGDSGESEIPAPPADIPETPSTEAPQPPSTEAPPKEPEYPSDDTFLFADSDSRYLSEEELKNLSKEEVAIARNEIFARRGRIFTSQKWIDYFSAKSWYVPTYEAKDFDARMFEILNDVEQANMNLILAYEEKIA